MIYIDYCLLEDHERHFYKLEGDSFEIVELHIGKEATDWVGSGRDTTRNIPIEFMIKTDAGVSKSFFIDCGYTERTDWNNKNVKTYKMAYFCIMDKKDSLYVKSSDFDADKHEWVTDDNFQKKISQFFINKVQNDTNFMNKRYEEMKKLDNLKTDFSE